MGIFTKSKPVNVLEGDIKSILFKLAIPSMGGMFAIIVFNITDTYFVSKLGVDALAAMGFTFPVVMVIGAMASGISLGAGSILARAMGRGDHHLMNRIASDGILLSILIVFFVSILGLISIKPVFTLLGASGESLRLVSEYMVIWYSGAAVVIIPPISDSYMRSMGDMVRPFFVMLLCAVGNVILDPIMIFGWFGFPAMGIKGAALATVVSRSFGMVLTLSFVHFNYKLIDFKYKSLSELIESWRGILSIGIPSILVRLLPNLIRGVLTKLAAVVSGVAGVAAIAAGSRIESLSIIISMAIGVSVMPIVGQNYGAGNLERVRETRRIITVFAVIYGIALFIIAWLFAEPISRVFTNDVELLKLMKIYLIVVFIGSIGLNMYNWISESLNAIGKPKRSLLINMVGSLLVILPLLYLGSLLRGYIGMLVGLAVGQIIVGVFAVYISKKDY